MTFAQFIENFKVVIPIQTISFYNLKWEKRLPKDNVVIPIQTISFYNSPVLKDFEEVVWS